MCSSNVTEIKHWIWKLYFHLYKKKSWRCVGGPPTNMHVAGSTTSLLSVQIIFATFICAVPRCAFQIDALHSAFHLCHVRCYCVRVLLSLWSQHLSFCFTVLHSHKSSPLLFSLSLSVAFCLILCLRASLWFIQRLSVSLSVWPKKENSSLQIRVQRATRSLEYRVARAKRHWACFHAWWCGGLGSTGDQNWKICYIFS